MWKIFVKQIVCFQNRINKRTKTEVAPDVPIVMLHRFVLLFHGWAGGPQLSVPPYSLRVSCSEKIADACHEHMHRCQGKVKSSMFRTCPNVHFPTASPRKVHSEVVSKHFPIYLDLGVYLHNTCANNVGARARGGGSCARASGGGSCAEGDCSTEAPAAVRPGGLGASRHPASPVPPLPQYSLPPHPHPPASPNTCAN